MNPTATTVSLLSRTSCWFLGAALLGPLVLSASAQSGVWTNQANGNWSAAVNWKSAGIASGQDNIADFASVAWTSGHQTTLDAPYTIGTLRFGNASGAANTNYLIGANTLTLQTTTGIPTINASNQNAIVAVPLAASQQVLLNGNVLAITNAANASGQTGGWIFQASQAGIMGQGAMGNGPVTIGQSVGSGQTGFNMIDTAATGLAPVTLNNNFTIQTIRWIVGQNGCTFNSQPVTIAGTVFLNSGASNVRDIAVQPTISLTLSGVVSGGGTYGLTIGALAGTLNLLNSGNTFAPAVTLNTAGTIGASSDGALGFFSNPIKFTAANATFRALSSFTIGASRQLVFTAAGNLDTSNNTLQVDCPVTGAGAITKNGTGTLNLTAANTFSGAVTLNAGTFEVSGSGSLATSSGFTALTNTTLLFQDSASVPNAASYVVNNGGKMILAGSPTIKSSAPLTVNAGGLLDVSGLGSTFTLGAAQTLSGAGVVTGAVATVSGSTISGSLNFSNSVTAASGAAMIPGTAGTAGTLTVAGNLDLNGQIIQIDLTTNLVEGLGTNDEIVVAGNLNLSGGEKILLNYINGSLTPGTYKIIKFGALSGSFALATSYPNVAIDNGVGTPGYVTLVVSGPAVANNLFWKGDGSGNVWNIGTTANWVTNFLNPAVTYGDPASVTFNDFGSNNVPVVLNSTVFPNTVNFNITNKAYTLTGSGKITGPAPITITGGNAFTNQLANDNSGTMTILNSSKLVLAGGGAVGSGNISIAGAGNNGQVIVNNSGSTTLPNIVGSGNQPVVVQNGSGTTTLSGIADNAALLGTVNAGTLVLGKASSSTVHALGGATTVNTGGTLQLGGSGNDQLFNSVSVTMQGGTFDPASLLETFNQLTGFGTFNDSVGGGNVTVTNQPGFIVQNGTMTVSAGTITASGTPGVRINSTLNQTGGSVVYNGGSNTGNGVSGGGVLNMSGGTQGGAGIFYWCVGNGNNPTVVATANFSGGTFTSSGEFLQGLGGPALVTVSSNAILDLHYWSYGDKPLTNYINGGTVRADAFHWRAASALQLFLNGGTIKPKVNAANFFPDAGITASIGSQHAYVSTNGAIFDLGVNIGMLQGLEHDPSLGAALDGGLTLLNGGSMTLSGTNTFNGPITNQSSLLTINNAANVATVNLGDNAALQINLTQNGTSFTNTGLVLGSAAGNNTLTFNLGALGKPTVPLMQVNGTVTNLGPVTVNLTATSLLPIGSIPLIKYNSLDDANFLATWTITPANFYTLTLTNDTVNKLVSVIVAAGVTPKWVGNINSQWDTATSNWKTNTTSVVWQAGQPATFDDTATSYIVDISAGTVNPAFINMTNGSHTYLFTGSQGITGSGAFLKAGAGTLILSNAANSYSGVTTISGGSLVAAVPGILSASSDTTLTGSSLDVSSNNQTIGNLTLNNSPLLGNAALTGSGGTLTFNNNTPFTPAVTFASSMSLTFAGSAEVTLTNAAGIAASSASGNLSLLTGTGGVRCKNALAFGNVAGGGNNNWSDGIAVQIFSPSRLILDGSFTISKYLKLNGNGPDGLGAIVVTNGNVVVNGAPTQLGSDSSIYVAAGSSLLVQGAVGGNTTKFFGSGALTKNGPGVLAMDPGGNNTTTTINGGSIVISNTTTSGAFFVNNGATLAGSGNVNVVNVAAGGTLTPDQNGFIGTLTANAPLTNAGALTFQILKTVATTNADRLVANNAFVNTGSVSVSINTNSTVALAAGDSFKLFTLTNYAALASVTPSLPVLAAGLGWTNLLAQNGTIAVIATSSPISALAFLGGPVISGTGLTFSATNTGAGTIYLMTSTNLTTPRNAWIPVWTNILTGSGSFTTNLLNVVNPSVNQQFYFLSTTNQ